jgi:hypothetical protein
MQCNVGKADRSIRVLIGISIILAGFYYESWLGGGGVVPLVTAGLGWCPAYIPFGISTCKANFNKS